MEDRSTEKTETKVEESAKEESAKKAEDPANTAEETEKKAEKPAAKKEKNAKKVEKPAKKAENATNKAENTTNPVIEPQSEEHEEILKFLKKVKFRKKMIGGLDERSVWKKLEELNRLYDAAIRAEKISGKALVAEYNRVASAEIKKRDETIEQLKDMLAKACPDAIPTSGCNDEKG